MSATEGDTGSSALIHHLAEKFPDMRPVKSPPSLFTYNGFGVSLYGRRDLDDETGTHVKTQCLCALFIPILALRAFRVGGDGKAGWFILGRVPLSTPARAWNFLVLAAALALGGYSAWSSYLESDEYLAGKRIRAAEELEQSGKISLAASAYVRVASGNTSRAGKAGAALARLLDEHLPRLPLGEATELAAGIAREPSFLGRTTAISRLTGRGLEVVEMRAREDPRGSLALLDVLMPLYPEGNEPAAIEERVLGLCLDRAPEDVELASRMALILERRDGAEACESLLAPLQEKLGSSEGARILGQIYVRTNRIEEANALLSAYTEERLQRFHAAEKELDEAALRVRDQTVGELQRGEALGFSYQQYERLDEAGQQALVNQYIQGRIRRDPLTQAKQEALREEAGVVPVALDLGIIHLRRGQGMEDPAERKKELEAAEKTFLAIRGAAGETTEYRLFFGQVSYWLGKQEEGRAQFDELLKANDRSGAMLLAVAGALREVGDAAQARALAEEAYAKETEPGRKFDAAGFRSLMAVDVDDNIHWLSLADPANPQTVASLAAAQGEKASREGRDADAIAHLRKAIETYAAMPSGFASLNNGAIAHLNLFAITGDRRDYKRGAEMMEEALALKPDDSILVGNVAHTLLGSVVLDLAGESVEFNVLKRSPDLDLLSALFRDEAGYQALAQRFRAHQDLQRAISHLEKVLVLAPRSSSGTRGLLRIHSFTRDAAALRGLRSRFQAEDLDLTQANQRFLDHYAGKRDEEARKEIAAQMSRYERILASVSRERNPLTFAMAAVSWVGYALQGEAIGLAADPARLVQVAGDAHTLHPSEETRSCLILALSLRLSRSMEGKDADFAAMSARSRRSLPPDYLIAAALDRSEALRRAFTEDAGARAALDLLREQARDLPGHPEPVHWAIFKVVDPAGAEPIARALEGAEALQIARGMSLELSPLSATAALEGFWMKQLEGREAEGKDLLRRAARNGVPLPFDP